MKIINRLFSKMIAMVFTYWMKKQLEKDKEFQAVLKAADRDIEKLKSKVEEMEKQGMKVPDWAKHY